MSIPENTPLDIIEDSGQHTNVLSSIGCSMDFDRVQGSSMDRNQLRGTLNPRAGGQGDFPLPSTTPRAYALFPLIESIAHFKHHLNMTLSKLRDPLTVPQAKEELNELMTEHIINTDRMNTFLAALAGQSSAISMQGGSGGTSQLITSEKNRRKEMIKVFGEAAEIFEESLVTFVPKIIQYFQKILKETEVLYHMPVAQSLGKLTLNVVQKVEHEDDRLDQTRQILRAFHQNMQLPNQTLQTGSALCIKHLIQNSEPAVIQRMLLSTIKHLTESIKSKYCKSQKSLLECLQELLVVRDANSIDKVPLAFREDLVETAQIMEVLVPCLLAQGRGQQDAFSRKEAIKCFTLIANGIEKKEQLAAHKDEIIVLLQESKCDKAKPVREATHEALGIYRQIDSMFASDEAPREPAAAQSRAAVSDNNMITTKHKELTLGSPDSQIANNFYRNKENYDNFLLNQKPISYRNTEDHEIGPFNHGKSAESIGGQNQQFKSQKYDRSPIIAVENQQENNDGGSGAGHSGSFQGTPRTAQALRDQDREMLKTSPSYHQRHHSNLDQKIQNHQRRVQEQFQASERNVQNNNNEGSDPMSSVRTVIQQMEHVETPGNKGNSDLPPKQRASASKSNLTNHTQKNGYKANQFENGSPISAHNRPLQLRTNGSVQKFPHLKIQITEGSAGPGGMASERSRYKSRPSTTRNKNGRKLSGRGQVQQREGNAVAATAKQGVYTSRRSNQFHRSSSHTNYLSRNTNEDGSTTGLITGKLTMATRKKLESKQQLQQHPSSAISRTAPQRNSKIDWNSQAQKNRQSIFRGPRNGSFFRHKNSENDENRGSDIEIFTARGENPQQQQQQQSGTLKELRELMLSDSPSPKQQQDEQALTGGNNSNTQDRQQNNPAFISKDADFQYGKGIRKSDQGQARQPNNFIHQSNEIMNQNHNGEGQIQERDFQEMELGNATNPDNSFLSNFGKQFRADPQVKGGSGGAPAIEREDQLSQNNQQQKFVILRKTKNIDEINEDGGSEMDIGDLGDDGAGKRPGVMEFDMTDLGRAELPNQRQQQKFDQINNKAAVNVFNENSGFMNSVEEAQHNDLPMKDRRESKIICDDDYQNFRGSYVAGTEPSQQVRKHNNSMQGFAAAGRDHQFRPQPPGGPDRPSNITNSSSRGPFFSQIDKSHNLTPPQDPKVQNLKDMIVLRQMNTEGVNDYSQENGGRLNRITHINETLFTHARVGSGDHKIIGGADNSFSLNSEMGLIHNLTQQEWSNSHNRNSPEGNFSKLRAAQLDFNQLQKQRMQVAAQTSMTQTNHSVKNQVIDDFSISCLRQSQCTGGGGVPNETTDNSSKFHQRKVGNEELTGNSLSRHGIVQEEQSEEQNRNLPTTMASGDKANNQNFNGEKLRLFNDNVMLSDQQTHSASQPCSNQPTPRYPEPSAGKVISPKNMSKYISVMPTCFDLNNLQINSTQGRTHSSREIGSTIHDIDLRTDNNLTLQILQEVQGLRDENRQLREYVARIEETYQRKQSENEIRIKALETLFLENKVPTHLQSIEPTEDQHDSSTNFNGERGHKSSLKNDHSRYHHSRGSNLSLNQLSQRRSTMNEELNSLNRSKVEEYMMNSGIDLANKKPIFQQQQQIFQNQPQNVSQQTVQSAQMQPSTAQQPEQMISTRRAQEKIADANQVVELALGSHNVSFLYQLMDNQKKFEEISPDNVNKLLQFTFQKLTLQKGRYRISSARRDSERSVSRQNSYDGRDSSKIESITARSSVRSRSKSFVVDHGLVDSLLLLTMKIIDIHMPLGAIDMNSTVFLDLIQLFIDLLKEESILTSLQKIKLQQIYEKIEKQF